MLKNYINGTWCESKGEQAFPVINPANEKIIAQCPLNNSNDVKDAVQAAAAAFDNWRSTPAIDRVQFLFRLKALMEEEIGQLSKVVTAENGKTLAESRASIRRAIQMLDTASGIPNLMMGEFSEDIARGIDCSVARRPLGVYACIAPFNFPVMIPFWFWPFAIACGNTFIVKPSERVPMSMQAVFELIDRLDLPKGVLNLLHGGADVATQLCQEEQIQGVSFVGSTPIAKQVHKEASLHTKRVQALGGAKNVMLVLPDSMGKENSGKTVNTAIESVTGCAGERCLAASIVLSVGDQTYKKFEEECLSKSKKITVGDGADPASQMGPLISKEAKNRIEGLIDRAIEQGARLVLDGRGSHKDSKGFFMSPSILADIKPEMEIAQVEIFGPVILLGVVQSLDEALKWINALPFANTASIFTKSGAAARKFINKAHPSMIGVNIGVPAPMSFFSFGGSKDSFFGDVKAHGKSCIEFYTEAYTSIYRWDSDEGIW